MRGSNRGHPSGADFGTSSWVTGYCSSRLRWPGKRLRFTVVYGLAVGFRSHARIPKRIAASTNSLACIESLDRACGRIVGAAAGSLFVFKGAYRAVLINYPSPAQRDQIARAAG